MMRNAAAWKRVNAVVSESARSRGDRVLAIVDYLRGLAKQGEGCEDILAEIDFWSPSAEGFDPILNDSFEGTALFQQGIELASRFVRSHSSPESARESLNEMARSLQEPGDGTITVSNVEIERAAAAAPEFIPSPAMMSILREAVAAGSIHEGLPHLAVVRAIVAYENKTGAGPLSRLGALSTVVSRLASRRAEQSP